jgi:hypothetical protein
MVDNDIRKESCDQDAVCTASAADEAASVERDLGYNASAVLLEQLVCLESGLQCLRVHIVVLVTPYQCVPAP